VARLTLTKPTASRLRAINDQYVAIIADGKGVIPNGTRIPVPNQKMKWDEGNPTAWHPVHRHRRPSVLLRGAGWRLINSPKLEDGRSVAFLAAEQPECRSLQHGIPRLRAG
jgi:hypothetical protein